MASYMDLKGTTRSTFQVEKGGPLLKNDSNVVAFRNAADSAYSDIYCDTLNVNDPSGSRTSLKVPATDPTGITGADAISNLVSLTQVEYDAITPNSSTLYFITT